MCLGHMHIYYLYVIQTETINIKHIVYLYTHSLLGMIAAIYLGDGPNISTLIFIKCWTGILSYGYMIY